VAGAAEIVRENVPPPSFAEARPQAPAPAYAPPPLELEWPSDLVQVESDPNKVQAAREEPVQQAPALRPRRPRREPTPVADEPLIQIETQRHDAPAEVATPTPASGQATTDRPAAAHPDV
jgi:hypothetical protein